LSILTIYEKELFIKHTNDPLDEK